VAQLDQVENWKTGCDSAVLLLEGSTVIRCLVYHIIFILSI
jgi:hypothetical protein